MAGKNHLLDELLDEVGWSRTRTANEVNACMGAGYTSRSSISEWVNNGRVPHDPLPTVVAHLLSDAVGRTITVAELWHDAVKQSKLWMPADYGHPMSWNYDGVLASAHDWLINTGKTMGTDRRQFMAISGAALTAPAWAYLETPTTKGSPPVGKNPSVPGSMKTTPGVVNALETTISGLRKLDDHEGGNPNSLRLAHNHFRTLAEYIHSGNTGDSRTQKRLLAAWANLCQLCGWMAFDAQRHGLAQRYYRTGLQITHHIGDRELGTHILALLSIQSSYREQEKDATQLANAAMETAKNSSPAVRALAASRYAQAQAISGNSYGCHDAIDKARNLINASDALQTRPQWLYWLDPKTLEARTAWSLLALAHTSPRPPHRVLQQSDDLLAPRVKVDSEFPRDALYSGAWLVRSYVWRNELEQAIKTGAILLELLRSVRSSRSTAILRKLTKELAQHRSAASKPEVVEFRQELQHALATAA